MVNLLREEAKRFATTTSMKGLPRVAKAQNCGCRMGWCMVVLGFLVLSIYQTTLLVLKFSSYEKYTKIIEMPINPLKMPDLPVLPDVTICNLNPMTSDLSKYKGFPTYRQYQEMIMEITDCSNCSEQLKEQMKDIKPDLMSLLGYTQYIGKENSIKIGHQMSEFLLGCHAYIVDGLKKKTIPCENMLTIHQFHFYENFNCINLRLKNKTQGNNNGIFGIRFVFYLDNFDEEMDYAYEALEFNGQTSGVLYFVHEQFTVPYRDKGQMLMPGVFSNVRMSLQHRQRLGPPYGICVEEYAKGKYIYLNEKGEYVARSQYVCLSECLFSYIWEACGCMDLYQIIPGSNASLPTCADAKINRELLAKRMTCAAELRASKMGHCIEECSIPCRETIYQTELQQSVWPRKSHLRAFYNHYIADKPYRDKFSILKNISKANSSQVDLLVAERLVRDNFVQVAMYLQDFNFILLQDSPKADFASLMSQIGGTLNLWSGITVFLIVEVIECLYRLITNCNSATETEVIDLKSKESAAL